MLKIAHRKLMAILRATATSSDCTCHYFIVTVICKTIDALLHMHIYTNEGMPIFMQSIIGIHCTQTQSFLTSFFLQ